LKPHFQVDPRVPLVQLGLGSMRAVELTAQLSRLFGLRLSPTLVYEAVTVVGMAEAMLEQLQPLFRTATAPAAAPVSSSSTSAALAAAASAASFATAAATSGAVGAVAALERMVGRVDAPLRSEICVFGMGCRLPGAADTPTRLFDNLLARMDSVGAAPLDRPTHGQPGGYLTASTLERFNCDTFAVTRTEAAAMDPQQRLLLHATHDALAEVPPCLVPVTWPLVGAVCRI
jgi:polyketide synthase PksN